MKILVIGLDGAAPEILLGDERLSTIRSLMEIGCYGRLDNVLAPGSAPAWMCLATGQDPGSLGFYGSRNRHDHETQLVDARSFQAPTMWEQVAKEGGRSILVDVPPGYPPRPVDGISVCCLPPPDAVDGTLTHPPEVATAIEKLVGTYAVDPRDFRTDDEAGLSHKILAVSRKQFTVVRHLMENEPWDYFHFVELGLDWIQRAFGRVQDAEGPSAEVVRDYYLHLDEELAKVLDLLTEDTVVLVVSVQDARAGRSFGGASEPSSQIREGDPADDKGDRVHHGAFILASPQVPPVGEVEGARLLDIAPTLLELAGHPPLPDAQGRNILEGRLPTEPPPGDAIDDDELVRERLRGLGYIG
ncbi:alkaline phosphatase family protein [Paludisphaera mucosa]|uniref:Alkaline phosphatase family protein n=1 Tax=Paludisphaera mucosa TaxID=3030827 RepID=A0ABT6F5T5_9BACT|nr:alkaline phosphatase family protein [Paludisphaera mucosa]MDG3002956.1 alkaline phosphatase family protein [Paludisphaera mucosa]